MNYFGLFFSFLLPGIVVGILIGVWINESIAARRKKACRSRIQMVCTGERKRALYIHSVSDDHCDLAA